LTNINYIFIEKRLVSHCNAPFPNSGDDIYCDKTPYQIAGYWKYQEIQNYIEIYERELKDYNEKIVDARYKIILQAFTNM
jgi:hypothetical protein